MPQNTRRLSAQQRAHHRKLRGNVVDRSTDSSQRANTIPVTLRPEQSPPSQDESSGIAADLGQEQAKREVDASPVAIPPTIAKRRTRADQVALVGNVLLVKEIRRIAILSVILFAVLAVISISLR